MPDSVKPLSLRPGDRIGVVAPASNVDESHLKAGIAALSAMGYVPVHAPGILDKDLYFAGSVDRRVRELHEMFEREDVQAIICARGGYGANYLLPRIDVEVIRRHPKIFVGYSDVTCLLTYIHDATGLVTFHGPMVAKDFAENAGIDERGWYSLLAGQSQYVLDGESGLRSLAAGGSEGVLYGGCLSILVASLGTPYEAKTEGKLLFLEDIAAKPYQVDRMLMQLAMAGKLRDVKGIVFGEMLNCIQSPQQSYTLQEVVLRVLEELQIPVAYGLRSGHVSRENVTLPFGVRARLMVGDEEARLEIMESAVTRAR